MTQKTILVISSDIEINRYIDRTIAETHFSLITAVNNQVGLQKIHQEKPDIILCQCNQPGIDGYQLLTEIRKTSTTATIPFVFMTTQFEIKQWRRGMSLGADDFLIYPFAANELWEVVNTILTKQEALVSKYQQELDYLRSSILDFLPHEMRTALTGILASSDLLLNKLEVLDKSVIRELLDCMNLSSQRLSRLVDNFLLYSELNLISQNSEQIELLRCQKTCSSSETVECIATKCNQNHHRETTLSWQAEEIFLAISSSHLVKLVEELIDNALKFSSVNTGVLINGYQSGDYFHLSVIDRGRGMTAGQIAAIAACVQFERPIYEQQGCGLGLAIVKKIVHIYGGKIVINSVLNQETRVNIYLPLVKSSCFVELESHQKKHDKLRQSEIASAFSY